MKTIEIFLASSAELVEDRRAFEISLNRRNNMLIEEGIYLKLVIWEDFLDAMSQTRLQDEYNKALRKSDIFIMLFYTKVGKYTHEEFNEAFDEFKTNNKPLIYTYFKDAEGKISTEESVQDFKDHLSDLGHFYTVYKSQEGLELHFLKQLERLKNNGFLTGGGGTSKNDGGGNGAAASPSPAILDKIKMKVAGGDSIAKILDKHRDDILALGDDVDMELTMLQSRSTKLDKDTRIGIISSENANMERARIMSAFLSLLDDIKNDL